MDKTHLQTLLDYVRKKKGWDNDVLAACLELSRHGVTTAIPKLPKKVTGTPGDPAPLGIVVSENLSWAIDEIDNPVPESRVRWSILVEWALNIVRDQAVFGRERAPRR